MRAIRMRNSLWAVFMTIAFVFITSFGIEFTSVKVEAADGIPGYSGNASVQLNNNIPVFTADELTTVSYEKYGSFDYLGRCTSAIACVGVDIMPTEERGSIGTVKPTGWNQNKYPGIVNSTPPYLYNRCHLIGYQLTGENANEKNLITGTRFFNIEGMLPYENKVANYVKATGNHVMYRVTPVFEGNNLLSTGVRMEAFSVEDNGKGICFNVFCYNVQPGVAINYADGSNKLDEGYVISGAGGTEGVAVSTSQSVEESASSANAASYVANTNTKKFHYSSCSSVSNMKESNKLYHNGTRDDLVNQGYVACKRCNP